jgi:WD40 repeat protein
MSRIFLSHSSKDNFEAQAIGDWLASEGWDDVFLDLDPHRGISGGERWERALHQAAQRCEAVLFLVSHNWLGSGWCRKEYELARCLNKQLFAVIIETGLTIAELPEELKGVWQVVDLKGGQDHLLFRVDPPGSHEERHTSYSRAGLVRLKHGLEKAGLDAKFFAWPPAGEPERSPFRGLDPLEGDDAGVFFGRDAPIVETMDRLRGLSEAAAPRLLVILGASGAGKSSFLRAGLLPRLRRDDRRFVPLPVLRPGRGALYSRRESLVAALASVVRDRSPVELRDAVAKGAAGVRPLLTELSETAFRQTLGDEAQTRRPAIVIAIDQAEELFRSEGAEEGAALLALLRDLAVTDDPAVIVIFAIRSDSYDALEHAKPLEGMKQATLPLLPLPRGAYKEVIEGPARRQSEAGEKLAVEPQLTQALLDDLEAGGGSDALPLLAFTLSELYLEYRRAGLLRLADYQNFGGLGGAIDAAVNRAFARADSDPRIPRDHAARVALLRRGFIPWLAGIDPDTKSPRRNIARRSDIPPDAAPLIDLLVEERLLTVDAEQTDPQGRPKGAVTIEPTHEALLRQWGLLEGWLQEDFGLLASLEGVKRASRDWDANGRAEAWLAHRGPRLHEAERLKSRSDFWASIGDHDRLYLEACQTVDAREESERRQAEQLLEGANAAARHALSAALSALSVVAREKSPAQAVKLALAAWPRDALDPTPRLRTTIEALAAGVRELRERRAWRFTDQLIPILSTSVSERRALTEGADGVKLWNVATGALVATFAGHKESVLGAAYSAPFDRVVTTSGDKTARVWDAKSGARLFVWRGHFSDVEAVSLSDDGSLAVTLSRDKTARIWNVATGEAVSVLRGHQDKIRMAKFSPDAGAVATASDDATVRLWATRSGAPLSTLRGHQGGVTSVAFSHEGRLLVSGSQDQTLHIWSVSADQPRAVLAGHDGAVTAACFSPDRKFVFSASEDGTVRIWDVPTGEERLILRGHRAAVTSIAVSPDSGAILTGSDDGTARLWHARSGLELAKLVGHAAPLIATEFMAGGAGVATTASDGTVRRWDIRHCRELCELPGQFVNLRHAEFSLDDATLMTAEGHRTVEVWNSETGAPLLTIQASQYLESAAFSSDGKWIATGGRLEELGIWDAETGKEIRRFREKTREGYGRNSIRFTVDGKGLFVLTDSGAVYFPSILEDHRVEIVAPGGWAEGFALSPDDATLALWSKDGSTKLWDPASRRVRAVLPAHSVRRNGAAFSPDGSLIAITPNSGQVRVWSCQNGELAYELPLYNTYPDTSVFSPDGEHLVTYNRTSNNGPCVLKIWRTNGWKEVGAIIVPGGGIARFAFADSGSRFVTVDYNKVVRLWDFASGQALAEFRGHSESSALTYSAFSSNGARLVTVCSTGNFDEIKLWSFGSFPRGDLVRLATTRLPDLDLEDVTREYGLDNVRPIGLGQPQAILFGKDA